MTNLLELSLPYFLASSTASLMAAPAGVRLSTKNSLIAIRSKLRSMGESCAVGHNVAVLDHLSISMRRSKTPFSVLANSAMSLLARYSPQAFAADRRDCRRPSQRTAGQSAARRREPPWQSKAAVDGQTWPVIRRLVRVGRRQAGNLLRNPSSRYARDRSELGLFSTPSARALHEPGATAHVMARHLSRASERVGRSARLAAE